jgi:hypothetical protein
MHRTFAWLVLLLCARPAWADDDDDPAFARHSPTTQPTAPDDDDPGFSHAPPPAPPSQPATTQPATTQPATRPAAARPPAPKSKDLVGIEARFAYRTFTLPEMVRDTPGTGKMETQRFHVLDVDVYPISWWLRVGLASQFGIQVSSAPVDWYATEGIVVGFQRPGVDWTPWVEAGIHVGLGTREFYISEIDRQTDHLTMFWAQTGEVGVDGRIYQKLKLSLGIGAQHTSFYSNGTMMDPLVIAGNWSFTFKIGLGY